MLIFSLPADAGKTNAPLPGASLPAAERAPAAERDKAADDDALPRHSRRIPEIRDPARGMADPYTQREGDARTLDQLSRDRLNLEGKRSRSLEELASPLRERRINDAYRGRLRGLDERDAGLWGTRSRELYRSESTRRWRDQEAEDAEVYSTRPPDPPRVPGEPYGSPSHWRP